MLEASAAALPKHGKAGGVLRAQHSWDPTAGQVAEM